MLVQEPWCFRVRDVAELTDWQILNLYYLPAIERAKQIEISHSVGPHALDSPQRERGANFDANLAIGSGIKAPDPASPGFKDWYLRVMSPWMGKAAAERQFEVQKHEYETAPADAWWRKL